ncbi:MAG: DUF1549 domain-containing protein [Fuerstiella sp.]
MNSPPRETVLGTVCRLRFQAADAGSHHPASGTRIPLAQRRRLSEFSGISLWLMLTFIFIGQNCLAQESKVDFASQIKPLLSDRCFLCHGPDAETREADLRLDSEIGIRAALSSDSSRHAVVPGDPGASELISRIESTDPDVRMPPPDSGLSLNAAEQQLLRRWVSEGAEWKGHWAFEPIVRPALPTVSNLDWCRHEIDRFIVARQEAEGFPQNGMATRERLIRRATFDLTGLPPTLEEIDAFLADESTNAFEKVVDRLLQSEHFGERMAANWLDVARYSDTYGYQVDRDRFVWPWRDWVIQAFNSNMPYDRFITEQLAGDLLPDATRDQRLATTFNRLHPQKVEGGSVPEEFRVEYVADRTQTVATAFLGLTFECARCHDHKYDPISQREYYQLFSFFNNIDEAGLYSYFTSSVPTPTLRLPTEQQEQQLKEASGRMEAAAAAVSDYRKQMSSPERRSELLERLRAEAVDRVKDPTALVTGQVAALDFDTGSFGANQLVDSPRGKAVQLTGDHGIDVKVGNFPRWQPFTVSTWISTPATFDRSVVFHRSRAWTDAGSRGYELLIEDGRLSAALIHFWPGNAIRVRAVRPLEIDRWTHVTMTWDGSGRAAGLRLWIDGAAAETEIIRDNLYKNITGGGGDTITIGERFRDKGFARGLVDDFRVFDRELTPLEVRQLFDPASLPSLLSALHETDAADAPLELIQYAVATLDPTYQQLLHELQAARQTYCGLQDQLQEIMVMAESTASRQAYVLTRGAYDAHGDPVLSEVPQVLPARTAEMPANRLGLARWLTSADHPLTARVAVNRFWQLLFGHGLVRTPEDFGSQGTAPTHPLLLDWLAADFQSHQWDVKRLLKQILMSSTYQQSSAWEPATAALSAGSSTAGSSTVAGSTPAVSTATDDPRRRDPENLLLSRAPVFRLTAEMLRDNALAISGLLQPQIGGPPVRPYELAASFKPSKPDTGAGLYRRSLYTYWKRTAPAPMMMTLDASARDVCRVRRERTASPLQTLVVMNAPQFVEASRALADRLIQQHGASDDLILMDMFRLLTSRRPTHHEQQIVKSLLSAQLEHFAQDSDAASRYLAVGQAEFQADDPQRLAAWTSVANALFAFDETMMKR